MREFAVEWYVALSALNAAVQNVHTIEEEIDPWTSCSPCSRTSCAQSAWG